MRLKNAGLVLLKSVVGAVAAAGASAVLTLILSLLVCIGLNPEAAFAAEWSAAVMGLLWAGGLMAKSGRAVYFGLGLVVGLVWFAMWLFLVGRLNPHLWLAEGLLDIDWRHVLSWLFPPLASTIGGEIGVALERHHRLGKLAIYAAPPVVVIAVALLSTFTVQQPGDYALAPGVSVAMNGPDPGGDTTRLFTFDLAANRKLHVGLYDIDAHDIQPFDNRNMSFLATPAETVFDKLGPTALMVVNAGFYAWDGPGLRGSHVAPIVENGRAHYDLSQKPLPWTFGWKMVDGKPQFRLVDGLRFQQLSDVFDNALVEVRALVKNGKPIEVTQGPGLPFLNTSRVSVGWSADSSKLYVLVVRSSSGEREATAFWRVAHKKTHGWDLPRLQKFWMQRGVANAVALDGGDSTQLTFRDVAKTRSISSGRYASYTAGHILGKPVKIWLPIFPLRHNHNGVMNYIYVRE